MEYQKAHSSAERTQQNLVESLPIKLIGQEDQFLEKIQKAKVGPLRKLEKLYTLMDKLSKFISRFTPCKKGCSACCHYKVSVSKIEVAYIEERTHFHRNTTLGPAKDFHGEPCPFLNEGSCSIYEARPFVCRRHHMLTPNAYWCAPERSNNEQFPLVRFTNVDGAFEVIRQESKLEEPYDIRQFFC